MSKKKDKHVDKLYRDEKTCFFTIAYGDERNKQYATKMLNSLRKFHPNIKHFMFTDKDIDPIADPEKKFRLYAYFGMELSKTYDTVIQIDNDSIVTGSLDHILGDMSYDLGGVLNNNLIDLPLSIYDVPPVVYINAGFLVARGQRFWNWWNKLNHSPAFNVNRFREQDMLNIIFHYGDLRTKIFDFSDKWHGLVHKGQWSKMVMRDGKLILPKTEGVCEEDKEIKIIHWAGGNAVIKLNYRVFFKPEVVKYLDELVA